MTKQSIFGENIFGTGTKQLWQKLEPFFVAFPFRSHAIVIWEIRLWRSVRRDKSWHASNQSTNVYKRVHALLGILVLKTGVFTMSSHIAYTYNVDVFLRPLMRLCLPAAMESIDFNDLRCSWSLVLQRVWFGREEGWCWYGNLCVTAAFDSPIPYSVSLLGFDAYILVLSAGFAFFQMPFRVVHIYVLWLNPRQPL